MVFFILLLNALSAIHFGYNGYPYMCVPVSAAIMAVFVKIEKSSFKSIKEGRSAISSMIMLFSIFTIKMTLWYFASKWFHNMIK